MAQVVTEGGIGCRKEQDSIQVTAQKGHNFQAWAPFWEGVQGIAELRLPPSTVDRVEAFERAFHADPRPVTFSHLPASVSEGKLDWFARFKWSIYADMLSGLKATHYHLDNIDKIERDVLRFAFTNLPEKNLSVNAVAGGQTSRLDAEYQAFAFAGRRTLEYFSNAVAAFFKAESNSIRRMLKGLSSKEPVAIAQKVISILDLSRMRRFVSEDGSQGEEKSLRDRLGHERSVPAGCLNIIKGPRGGIAIGFYGDVQQRDANQMDSLKAVFSVGPGQVVVTHSIGLLARQDWEEVERQMFDVLFSLVDASA